MEWGQIRWEVERKGGEEDGKQIGTGVKMMQKSMEWG
jgi:hypothetical protein